jgi:hypothetical protein
MDAFERLVTVNRSNPAGHVSIRIPLTNILDKRWCEEMSRSIMMRSKWTVCEATSTLHETLPAKMGLYMFVWKIPFPMPCTKFTDSHFRTIVYIGHAGGKSAENTLQKRYRQEYSTIVGCYPESLWSTEPKTRDEKLRRFLNLRDLEFWYHEHMNDWALLEVFENELISIYNPPANTNGKSSGSDSAFAATLGKAIPAF